MDFNIRSLQDNDPFAKFYELMLYMMTNKIIRFLTYFVYIFHSIGELITFVHLVMHYNFSLYMGTFLGILGSLTYITALFFLKNIIFGVYSELKEQCWSPDSCSKETELKILKQIKLIKFFAFIYFCIIAGTGIIQMPPDFQYNWHYFIIFLQTSCPSLFWLRHIYKITLGSLGLVFVIFANIFMYTIYQAMFQMYMICDVIRSIDEKYESNTDEELLADEEYQKFVGGNLAIVARQAALLKVTQTNVLAKFAVLIPIFSFGGVCMVLSLMCFLSLYDTFPFYAKIQLTMWLAATAIPLLIFSVVGQSYEDHMPNIFGCLCSTRWVAWNQNNKKKLLFMLMQTNMPFTLGFSESYTINYNFLVSIIKVCYSMTAIAVKVRQAN